MSVTLPVWAIGSAATVVDWVGGFLSCWRLSACRRCPLTQGCRAYIASCDACFQVITGATKTEQLKDNLAAVEV